MNRPEDKIFEEPVEFPNDMDGNIKGLIDERYALPAYNKQSFYKLLRQE